MKKILVLVLVLALVLSITGCNLPGKKGDKDDLSFDETTKGDVTNKEPSDVSSEKIYSLTINKDNWGYFSYSNSNDPTHNSNKIYREEILSNILNSLQKQPLSEKQLAYFKSYIESSLINPNSDFSKAVTGVQYSYDLNIPIYTENIDGKIVKSDTAEIMTKMLAKYMLGVASGGANLGGSNLDSVDTSMMNSSMMGTMMGLTLWQELLSDKPDSNGNSALINPVLKEQYDLVKGEWPSAYDEIVLVLDKNNELNDLTLYALGLISEDEINDIIESAVNRVPLDTPSKTSWSYDEIVYNLETGEGLTFKSLLPSDFYRDLDGDGIFTELDPKNSDYSFSIKNLYNNALELKVVGIIRPDENSESTMLSGSIGYTRALTEYIITKSAESPVVKAQLANPTVDVLTGLPFKEASGKLSSAEKKVEFTKYVSNLSNEKRLELLMSVLCIKAEISIVPETDVTLLDYMVANAKANIMAMLEEAGDDVDQKIAILMTFLAGDGADMDVGSFDTDIIRESLASLSNEEIIKVIEEYIVLGCRGEIIKTYVMPQLIGKDEATMLAMLDGTLTMSTDEEFALYYDRLTVFSESNYDENLITIGSIDLAYPTSISIYTSSMENKKKVIDMLKTISSCFEQ